jgi:hypothetical protein
MPNTLLATLLLLWWFLIQFNAKYSSGYPPPLVVVSPAPLPTRLPDSRPQFPP